MKTKEETLCPEDCEYIHREGVGKFRCLKYGWRIYMSLEHHPRLLKCHACYVEREN